MARVRGLDLQVRQVADARSWTSDDAGMRVGLTRHALVAVTILHRTVSRLHAQSTDPCDAPIPTIKAQMIQESGARYPGSWARAPTSPTAPAGVVAGAAPIHYTAATRRCASRRTSVQTWCASIVRCCGKGVGTDDSRNFGAYSDAFCAQLDRRTVLEFPLSY